MQQVKKGGENADLLQILVFRHTLTREQAERVRRQARSAGASDADTVQALGMATEDQIAQAVAGFTNLKFVKLNPLELDLDVVTGAFSGPFSRRHGLVAIAKTDEKLTVAVHDPFANFPTDDIKRVTGLRTIEKVVSTKSDIEAIIKSFYELGSSLKTAEKQLSAQWLPALAIGTQEYLSSEDQELDPAAAPVVKRSITCSATRSSSARRTSTSNRNATSRSCACASTACCTTSTSSPRWSIRRLCRASSCSRAATSPRSAGRRTAA